MPANRNTDPAPDRSNRGSEASLLIPGEPGDDDDDNNVDDGVSTEQQKKQPTFVHIV